MRVTERLKFLVAFRPGLYSPTLAAQMAPTFQRQSEGRLLVNVVTGGESAEQRAYGDFLDKDGRYARTDEFLEHRAAPVAGRTRRLRRHAPARRRRPRLAARPDPIPDVYFGGSSPAAIARRRPPRRRLPDLG